MIKRIQKRKCKHCKDFFLPDYRNAGRQKFCGKPECRKASKAESQRKWLQKPENRDYFKGPDNVQRVREWRKTHPGYRRRKKSCTQNALQDTCPENDNKKHTVNPVFVENALQDSCLSQPAVLIGLISQLTGFVLQDDIAMTIRSMQKSGRDILTNPNFCKGGHHGKKIPHRPGQSPPPAKTFQLGGSSPGP